MSVRYLSCVCITIQKTPIHLGFLRSEDCFLKASRIQSILNLILVPVLPTPKSRSANRTLPTWTPTIGLPRRTTRIRFPTNPLPSPNPYHKRQTWVSSTETTTSHLAPTPTTAAEEVPIPAVCLPPAAHEAAAAAHSYDPAQVPPTTTPTTRAQPQVLSSEVVRAGFSAGEAVRAIIREDQEMGISVIWCIGYRE